MGRILVSGSTGFIGLHVSRLLSTSGETPRLMFRRPDRAALIAPLEAELVCADLSSNESLRRAVHGVETVIHLAARATFERRGLLQPTIVEGTKRLADAAAASGVKKFVFASSTFVYGSSELPVTASSPAEPVIDYGHAKLRAETALSEIGRHRGVDIAILRLPHVYGPESLLFDHARRGVCVFAGDISRHFSHLQVDDAARALVAAARTDWTGTAPIADFEPVAWRTFLHVLQTYLPRVKVRRLPPAATRSVLRVAEPLLSRAGRPTMAAPDTVTGWTLEQRVDSRDTWKALGIEPLHESIHTGIPASLDAAMPYRWVHPLADKS